ncbi:glycosyl hydrolase family 65 protein [Arcanobacterium hippocoleae]
MEWTFRETGFNQERIELLGSKFSIANGYFGYRGTLQEYTANELVACTLSEIFDDNGSGWREPVNMPNALYTKSVCAGVPLSVLETPPAHHEQGIAIDTGRQFRSSIFELADGVTVRIDAEQFASIENHHLLLMRYRVILESEHANSSYPLEITTGIDTDVWNINGNHFAACNPRSEDDAAGFVCETIETGAKAAIARKIAVTAGEADICSDGAMWYLRAQLAPGKAVEFESYAAICKETDCPDVWQAALANLHLAAQAGFSALLDTQLARWTERYNQLGIAIEGDEEAQRAVLYSCYLLYSTAPAHTDTVAIPARGLSGQVYKGAYFWDTEMHMIPMFAYCTPEIARNLMMYRVKNLQGALEKAKEYGYRGAFYPWESQENGKDGCTLYNLTDIFTGRKMRTYFRDKQVHISADVVYGIWKYVQITGDESIYLAGGAETIFEVARFYNSFAYFKMDKGRYELLDVTGADEYHERVNNDAFTNYMVKFTAKTALEVAAWLEREHPEKYAQILHELDYHDELKNVRDMYERIYVPTPNEQGIIEQFDTYFQQEDLSLEELYSRIIKPNEYLGSPVGLAVNTQILKQPDVVLVMSLLSDWFSDEVKLQNWEYYEPRTEHGSSLSTCMYALLAAKIGKVDWAYKFFLKAARLDLDGNYKQYLGSLYIGGTHPAANGGTWMALVLGFGGLEVSAAGVILDPHLPQGWKRLSYAFNYASCRAKAEITAGTITIHLAADAPKVLHVQVKGNDYECAPGDSVTIRY